MRRVKDLVFFQGLSNISSIFCTKSFYCKYCISACGKYQFKAKTRKLLLICGFYKVREHYYYNVEYTCTYMRSIIMLYCIQSLHSSIYELFDFKNCNACGKFGCLDGKVFHIGISRISTNFSLQNLLFVNAHPVYPMFQILWDDNSSECIVLSRICHNIILHC